MSVIGREAQAFLDGKAEGKAEAVTEITAWLDGVADSNGVPDSWYANQVRDFARAIERGDPFNPGKTP